MAGAAVKSARSRRRSDARASARVATSTDTNSVSSSRASSASSRAFVSAAPTMPRRAKRPFGSTATATGSAQQASARCSAYRSLASTVWVSNAQSGAVADGGDTVCVERGRGRLGSNTDASRWAAATKRTSCWTSVILAAPRGPAKRMRSEYGLKDSALTARVNSACISPVSLRADTSKRSPERFSLSAISPDARMAKSRATRTGCQSRLSSHRTKPRTNRSQSNPASIAASSVTGPAVPAWRTRINSSAVSAS